MRIILLQGKSIPIPLKTDSDNLEEIKGLCGNLLTVNKKKISIPIFSIFSEEI